MRRFVTPRTEVETSKILRENFLAMDPELKGVLDQRPTELGIVVLPEAVTNPSRPSLLDRANILIGRVMLGSLREPKQTHAPDDEDEAWNNLLGH